MRVLGVVLLILITFLALTDSSFPQDEFRSPLGIPLSLSGNFGEMRSNHFHSGLDIRTKGQTGYRVYASRQGYVARIAVSPSGFGNALYVTHPGGYQTVYAHLSRFEEPIASWVREQQYARRSFNVNLFPDRDLFPVSQGSVIAYSGNSGGSGGPHLHFEIRDAASSEPLNGLLFGLNVPDTTPPRIFRIKAYAASNDAALEIQSPSGAVARSMSSDGSISVEAEAVASGGYRLSDGAVIHARGSIAFAIQTQDHHDGSRSRLGVFRIVLARDGTEVFASRMERFSFADTRYINAHIDYGERARNGRWMQRSHVLPGNRLRLYRAPNDGYLRIQPGDSLRMQYEVYDAFGNATVLPFLVVGDAGIEPVGSAPEYAVMLQPGLYETLVRPGFIARFPENSVYEPTPVTYGQLPRPADGYSAEHVLHDPAFPLHGYATLSVAATTLPEKLRPRAVLAIRSPQGRLSSVGGTLDGEMMTARVRSFGHYVVAVDTLSPKITPVNVKDGADLGRAASIRLKISDEFSGIASFEGRVDDQWVLFAHDPKTSSIEHVFDGKVGPGAHRLEVRVTDGVGHSTYYRAAFTR